MTDNKNRGKLTLKLKLPSAADPKALALKSAEKKRISNSMVQVAIKGRRNSQNLDENLDSKTLNTKELEARKAAISNASDDKKIQDIAEPVTKVEEEIEVVKQDISDTKVSEYKVDHLDIRSKIKASVASDNSKQEARKKDLEEKKRLELEKSQEVDNQKEKEKRSKFKKNNYVDEEEERAKKKGKQSSFKDKRKSGRRLLQTFIVGDEDDGSAYSRHRKKSKIREHDPDKEYVKVTKEVIIPELISVSDLSDRMSEKPGDVVKKLFIMGVVATSNQVIDADTAQLIVEEFGHTVKRVQDSDVENVLEFHDEDNVKKLDRAPVVTIMGHVDHGKTSLLDAMKSTNVAAGESGGITQHIGASRVKTKSGKYITFLDTPGHEAFTAMRLRGANATDIVVLVVAADDGIKEQTIEAINHAKVAKAPIIVAINKIDKVGADVTKAKNELLSHDIISEDLGGDVMFVEVSAKEKTNLAALEEAILLQAEILELKSPYDCKARGVVIESKVDASKGVVATLIVQGGTLNVADIVVAGTSYGKVKKMVDSQGKNLKIATPSMPIEILGLDKAPNAGDQFSVVTEEKQARDIIAYRSKKERDIRALQNSAKSIDDIFKEASAGGIKHLPIIIKGDVHGSVEAIVGSLLKLNTDEVAIKVVHQATGAITQSDVSLAEVSGAIIIGFNVRANNVTKDAAREKNIDIRYHAIIYNVIDELKLLLGGMLDPIKTEEHLGNAEIRQVFKVSGSGMIAGCFVTNGLIKRGAKVRLLRDNVVIYDGDLKTLKRFKDDVKEVKNNFECGVALENFDDMKESDIIECYEVVETIRKL